MTDPIRVVLVDDQELVRTGFRMILDVEPDITVVGEAGDGIEAGEVVRVTQPHVVLMDIRMPRRDGVEATEDITTNTRSKVVILTTFDVDDYIFAALANGASGFLLKDTPAEDLVDAVRIVAGGDALLAPSATRRLIEQFQRSAGSANHGVETPGLDQLTDRETDVLVEMAKGLSNAEIGKVLYVGETTVKTHVGRILQKLGVRDRVQAVVAAYNSGLVSPGGS